MKPQLYVFLKNKPFLVMVFFCNKCLIYPLDFSIFPLLQSPDTYFLSFHNSVPDDSCYLIIVIDDILTSDILRYLMSKFGT